MEVDKQLQCLYVRVVKAKNLPQNDVTGNCDPYVEVSLGNYKNTTHHFEENSSPEWNQLFTFSKDRIEEGSILEIIVKNKDVVNDDFIGQVVFDLNEIPKMVSHDSPLASQWYRLEDKKNEKTKGELMLAVWMGTEADEVSHLDAAEPNIRSSVYLSPKLWYVRVNVIEAKNLQLGDESRSPEVFVKAILGHQALNTKKVSTGKSINPMWNEELMFVAAEPFEEPLMLSIEDHVGRKKDEVLGRCVIPLQYVDRRLDHKPVNSRWYHVEKYVSDEGEKQQEIKLARTICMRICLEGGYHVFDELPRCSSDLRPTAKQLWKSSIGVLELGILSAHGLFPMKIKEDGRGTTNAYCVAKYGHEWVKTKTAIDSLSPIWNEHYTWEVFDPCTVVTVGVFHNCHFQGGDKSGRDLGIGRVRIRLSTFEMNCVYTHSYPLLVLHPSGVKKMGEIHLAVRFACSSLINMMHTYSQPLLPKMHYICPLTGIQLDTLRFQATLIISTRLSRAEPPLRKEVAEYILGADSYLWSMRRHKVNISRIMGLLSGFIAFRKWFDEICNWKNPIATILIHVLFLILVMYRQLILPSIFLCLFLIIIWYYIWRPKYPLHIDTRLSCVDDVHPEDLDEEFDTFPTSRPIGIVRMRYDRLRRIAGRYQTMIGDWATQGERVQGLVGWRDPRATVIFAVFCLIAVIILYITPFEVVAVLTGFYVLRHPRLRYKVPPVLSNFFRRLPARTDCIL